MSFMNEFLERNWGTMKSFLTSVSSPGSAIHMAAYEDSIDLALELSILHSLLCNIFSSLEEVQLPSVHVCHHPLIFCLSRLVFPPQWQDTRGLFMTGMQFEGRGPKESGGLSVSKSNHKIPGS